MKEEIWKLLPQQNNNRYEVSNHGNVRSYYHSPDGKPKLLSIRNNKLGYPTVCLILGGKQRTVLVHQLVALLFVPNPFFYKEINHIDGNKENNYFENLEWCTRSHNVKEAFALGLKTNKKGSESCHAVSFNQFDLDGNFIQHWGSIVECAEYLFEQGCSDIRRTIETGIGDCLRGRNKTCCGFIFSKEDSVNPEKHKPEFNTKKIMGVHKKDKSVIRFNSFHDADGFITKEGKKLSGTLICACIKGRRANSHGGYTWMYDAS